jgi:hypothetical protein
MVVQVFMSHTKLDGECCDRFDSAAARVGLKVFRSEFETIQSPAWKTIKDEIICTVSASWKRTGKSSGVVGFRPEGKRRLETHTKLDCLRDRSGLSARDRCLGHLRLYPHQFSRSLS